ncbi:MAG: aminofutalosine synthase MqnE [Planctomycetes bacterium]|nr:aminofutalosine synthase MqnE [Planctomycetota bacterium]
MNKLFDKIKNNVRLSLEDGMKLYDSNDLAALGQMADYVREKKNRNYTYFIVNRHVNYTNICVNRCKFCAFSCDPDDKNAYLMPIKDIIVKAGLAKKEGASEIHIVGGLHPDVPFDYYLEMMRELKATVPGMHIQAFTAVEIAHFAKISGLSVEKTLAGLAKAGLDSLPGGGAEIFDAQVRQSICEKKISGDEWLRIHETAHKMGMHSNATMLYGHKETPEQRVEHLLKLRALQDETNGFMAFIPLPFHPANTQMSETARTTGMDDLKTMAVSRIMLDNFPHIKSFWIMLGIKLAQVALHFGADDLDGTVEEEKITHSAGATTPESLTKDEIIALIKSAYRTPVERDTLYNKLKIY